MSNLNAYIISVNPEDLNTDRYVKRRQKILKNYQDYSGEIDFHIFDAVTPNNYEIWESDMPYKYEIIYNRKDTFISDMNKDLYISNILSHRELWKEPGGSLIFEDDILWDENLFDRLIPLIEKFEKMNLDNGILYLQISNPWSKGGPAKNFHDLKPEKDIQFEHALGNFLGTVAYYVPEKTKEILLKNSIELEICDGYLINLNKRGIIKMIIPRDRSLMARLDPETMLL